MWMTGAVLSAAVLGLAACDPADGLARGAVSVAVDQLSTHKLRNQHIDVDTLSCGTSTGKDAAGNDSATVTCHGQTVTQQKIAVTGWVSENVDNLCIRGHLTAVVAKRTIFDVTSLGNCDAPSPSSS
jgi:hypothetical protein